MGKRVGILDEVRGIAVISMVIYHLYFDLRYFYGIEMGGIVDTVFHWWQPLIAGTFIVVSGAACLYSSNNIRRGFLCFLVGMCFTFATAFLTPQAPITFGVLHLLGISMMLYGLIGRGIERLPSAAGIVLFALLYALCLNVPSGSLGFPGVFSFPLPDALYGAGLLFPLGFPPADYAALDYFPLLPHFFLFLAGASLGQIFKSGKAAKGLYMTRFSGLAWIGRHAMLIYILHQPVMIAAQELIFKCMGRQTMFLSYSII